MPLKEGLDTHKGVVTAWGKIIPEKEAYKYGLRHISAFSAHVFQVMRILEPDYDKRTTAICETAYEFNMMIPDAKGYVQEFRDEWNIPEFCTQGSWLGGLIGDYGDEYQDMSGRVIQFTPTRVEKELDTCPWDIVGCEMCNMTTAMFTANFDLNSSDGNPGEIALDMCEARGAGDMHCRVVAEKRDVYNRNEQGWLDHFGQPVDPVTPTPREKMFKEGQLLRNGKYTNVFGETKSLSWCYRWAMSQGWTWSVAFPLIAIRDMADTEEEFERIFKIVFATAGKASFVEPSAREGLRTWLGVPHEIDADDARILGSYIKTVMDAQLIPCELTRFDEQETRIKVKPTDFEGRFEMAPIEELTTGYEVMWHNMAKTLMSAEWSCFFEGKSDEVMTIVVGRKVDKKMC